MRALRCALSPKSCSGCLLAVTFVMDFLAETKSLPGSQGDKGGCAYNVAMGRFLEKLVVLACCVVCAVALFGVSAPILGGTAPGASTEGATVPAVVFLLAAVILSFGAGVVPEHLRRPASVGALMAYAVLSLASPVATAFLALPVYSAALGASAAWCLAAAVPLAVFWASGALEPGQLACTAAVAALALLLGCRSSALAAMEARSRSSRDALQERSLALESDVRALVDRQEREARVAVLEERGRIAREIHDNVGHLLTRSILQVEAFQVVHAGDDAVRSEFAQVGDTLHEALNTVRASVHNLRDDSIDLSVQVSGIVESCGLPVSAEVDVEGAPPEVASCLCAVIREALSNTMRHGGATRAWVTLLEHPGIWQLSVRDNGAMPAGAAVPSGGGGMGLPSMEERVRRLGGTFRAGWRADGGFEVFASVPKQATRTGEAGRIEKEAEVRS